MESVGPSFDTEFSEMNAWCLKYQCSLHTNTSYPVLASLPIFHTHHAFILLTINLYEKCHLCCCTLPLWLWQTAPSPTFLCPVSPNVSRCILNRDILSSKNSFLFSWFQLHTKFWDYKKIWPHCLSVSNYQRIKIIFIQQAKCSISQLFSTQLQKS